MRHIILDKVEWDTLSLVLKDLHALASHKNLCVCVSELLVVDLVMLSSHHHLCHSMVLLVFSEPTVSYPVSNFPTYKKWFVSLLRPSFSHTAPSSARSSSVAVFVSVGVLILYSFSCECPLYSNDSLHGQHISTMPSNKYIYLGKRQCQGQRVTMGRVSRAQVWYSTIMGTTEERLQIYTR